MKRFRAVILLLVGGVAAAQIPNPGGELNKLLEQKTGGRFRLIFEFRVRDESRTGNNFGLAKNLDNPLLRTRIGAQFDATDWFRISATGQDARAPDYGGVAPTTARDSMDLHEAYLEFFAQRKTGFGAVFGREVISLGEGRGRLIGDSQWTNTSRSYDTARLYYRLPAARIEVLMVSVVKIKADQFNVPDLGDRVWGTYDTFTKIIPKGTVDFYLLRHDQNRAGGFTGIGSLGTNTLGGRAEGPLPAKVEVQPRGGRPRRPHRPGPASRICVVQRHFPPRSAGLTARFGSGIQVCVRQPERRHARQYVRPALRVQPRPIWPRRPVRLAQRAQSAIPGNAACHETGGHQRDV